MKEVARCVMSDECNARTPLIENEATTATFLPFTVFTYLPTFPRILETGKDSSLALPDAMVGRSSMKLFKVHVRTCAGVITGAPEGSSRALAMHH